MERPTAFQLFMLIISVYVLIALVIEFTLTLPPQVSALLLMIDHLICVVFLLDFSVRFYQAENKWAFMKWGWIDLLASIPLVEELRVMRLFRIMRLLRLFRAIRSAKNIASWLLSQRNHGALSVAFGLSVLLVIFGSIAILLIEGPKQGPIDTGEEAIWWAIVTLTTVGYGDYYPVTTGGRIVAVFLMVGGLGLFGTFSGLIASRFFANSDEEAEDNRAIAALHEELTQTRLQVEQLHQRLEAHFAGALMDQEKSELNNPERRS